jgi:hypothetical protein
VPSKVTVLQVTVSVGVAGPMVNVLVAVPPLLYAGSVLLNVPTTLYVSAFVGLEQELKLVLVPV